MSPQCPFQAKNGKSEGSDKEPYTTQTCMVPIEVDTPDTLTRGQPLPLWYPFSTDKVWELLTYDLKSDLSLSIFLHIFSLINIKNTCHVISILFDTIFKAQFFCNDGTKVKTLVKGKQSPMKKLTFSLQRTERYLVIYTYTILESGMPNIALQGRSFHSRSDPL